eukprot:sb/3469749/
MDQYLLTPWPIHLRNRCQRIGLTLFFLNFFQISEKRREGDHMITRAPKKLMEGESERENDREERGRESERERHGGYMHLVQIKHTYEDGVTLLSSGKKLWPKVVRYPILPVAPLVVWIVVTYFRNPRFAPGLRPGARGLTKTGSRNLTTRLQMGKLISSPKCPNRSPEPPKNFLPLNSVGGGVKIGPNWHLYFHYESKNITTLRKGVETKTRALECVASSH